MTSFEKACGKSSHYILSHGFFVFCNFASDRYRDSFREKRFSLTPAFKATPKSMSRGFGVDGFEFRREKGGEVF